MLDIQTKLKHQLEIAGLAIANAEELRPVDLAALYDCEELTIKRDLSELRGSGIDIHSHKNGGISIDTPLPPRRLKELVAQYLSLCTAQRGVDNAVGLIEAMFRHSFKSWIGTEEHHIRLRLSPLWSRRLKPRQLFETQVITEESDGALILEATVNSLDEIASWVASRGEGVTVVAPDALRDKIIELAQGTLRNYG